MILWDTLRPEQRGGWEPPRPGGCPVATLWHLHPEVYAPCRGYVRQGRRFCWAHDPEIQTPEARANRTSESEFNVSRIFMRGLNKQEHDGADHRWWECKWTECPLTVTRDEARELARCMTDEQVLRVDQIGPKRLAVLRRWAGTLLHHHVGEAIPNWVGEATPPIR